MGRSGRSNKQVYMFCIDINPVGESNKWASYLNFACSFSACSYYWIYFIELPTMLLTFWQDGLYIISLCQRYCAELLICFLCTYCLVFVFFDKDFLLSKKKKKKNTKTNKEHLWHWFCSGSSSMCLVHSRRFSLSFFYYYYYYFFFINSICWTSLNRNRVQIWYITMNLILNCGRSIRHPNCTIIHTFGISSQCMCCIITTSIDVVCFSWVEPFQLLLDSFH